MTGSEASRAERRKGPPVIDLDALGLVSRASILSALSRGLPGRQPNSKGRERGQLEYGPAFGTGITRLPLTRSRDFIEIPARYYLGDWRDIRD